MCYTFVREINTWSYFTFHNFILNLILSKSFWLSFVYYVILLGITSLICVFCVGQLSVSRGSFNAHDKAGPEQSAQHGPSVAVLWEESQLWQSGSRPGQAGWYAQVRYDALHWCTNWECSLLLSEFICCMSTAQRSLYSRDWSTSPGPSFQPRVRPASPRWELMESSCMNWKRRWRYARSVL